MKKQKAKIICGCDKADKNCYLTCPQGRRINPDKVFVIPQWKKK